MCGAHYIIHYDGCFSVVDVVHLDAASLRAAQMMSEHESGHPVGPHWTADLMLGDRLLLTLRH